MKVIKCFSLSNPFTSFTVLQGKKCMHQKMFPLSQRVSQLFSNNFNTQAGPVLASTPTDNKDSVGGFAYRFLKNRTNFLKPSTPEKIEDPNVESVCLKIDQWSNLVGRNFLSLKHFKKEDLYQFLWTAKDLKARMKEHKESFELLKGINAVGVFHPNSAASKLTFEMAISKLGGNMTCLEPHDVEEMAKSNVKDTAKMLSRMSDMIVLGGYPQEFLDSLVKETAMPVISAYSQQQHVIQTMAQFLTVLEYFGYLRGVNMAWVGNGNNVLNSLLLGCAKLGVDLKAAVPQGHETDADVMIDATKMATKIGGTLQVGDDPVQAVYRADAILSGPWSKKDQNQQKLVQDFKGFQITRKMLTEAGGDWVFMHSLPRQQHEVTDDIFYGKESMVDTEIENRMWTAMAIMLHVNQPYLPTIPIPKFVRG